MNWYCVHVRPRKEARAARYLDETLGLDTFLPQLTRRQSIRGTRQTVVEPLFPRYFFCRMDVEIHLRAVRYAPEVADIVTLGQHPAVVDDAIIDELKMCARDTMDIDAANTLIPGCHVDIIAGPLRGLDGLLLHELSGHERVAILLTNLNYSASVVIGRTQFKCVA